MAAAKRKATAKSAETHRLPAISLAVTSDECMDARLIITAAHESADALLQAYELAREQRGRPRGMTTDKEQDLLRSMLVMAAAGLDATAKRLVEDALPRLICIDRKAQNSFEKYIGRRLEAPSSRTGGVSGSQLLAAALASPEPRQRLIEEYVRHLTAGSLQSASSLFEVAAALGVDPPRVGLDAEGLKPVFDARNKIIHELDIDLTARRRTRVVRSQRSMIRYSTVLLRLASAFTKSVDQRLASPADAANQDIP